MSDLSHKFLHVLNLDTIGGVERLFYTFMQSRQSTDHYCMATNKKAHPFFAPLFNQNKNSLYFSKYIGPFKLPSRYRKWNQDRITKTVNPKVIVAWNTIYRNSNACKGRVLFYDHGASWQPWSRKTQSYFDSLDSVICVSEASKKMLQYCWEFDKPIEVIHNPIIGIEDEPILEWKPASTFKIGIAGRLLPIKGFCLALHAISHLKRQGYPVELLIAGEGPEKKRLQELAHKLGIESQTKFLGCIRDMHAFYRQLHFFIAPSLREPFGLTALEAMASMPVPIVTNIDGLSEVLNADSGTLLTPELSVSDYKKLGSSDKGIPDFVYSADEDAILRPRSLEPEMIAKAISQYIDSPEKAAQVSLAGQKRAREKFKLQDYLDKLGKAIETQVLR